MINRYAKVGDKVIYKDYEGNNVCATIKQTAVRCGLDEHGRINSDEDYVILDNDSELDYKDGFDANKDIDTIKDYTKLLEKQLAEAKQFNNEHSYCGLFNIHDIETRIAKNEVIVAALEYFDTVKDDSYYLKVNDYINLGVSSWNGGIIIRFWLNDKIESEMYEYVWSSHSELNTKTSKIIEELLEFVFDFKSRTWIFNSLNDEDISAWKIRENDYTRRAVMDLKEMVAFLKSPEMESINVVIKEYFDRVIAIGKKHEEQGW